MIEKILNRFGFYKASFPKGEMLTEKEILELFRSYGENETFMRFLRDTCARDVRLYFQASTDKERDAIRGAHARTYYFISLIKKANDKRKRDSDSRGRGDTA